jgi:flagellar hook protein FlgE
LIGLQFDQQKSCHCLVCEKQIDYHSLTPQNGVKMKQLFVLANLIIDEDGYIVAAFQNEEDCLAVYQALQNSHSESLVVATA